ncbi:MAG: GNAT family N-acetyltransferase/peptidase C39 family protein [Leptospiraceae bacterium]|nr:GNAT family N-acetyltransferase/peptidase C39 family protein [Leptospiraceae bacterium]MCP5495609.1 GNAT family N-acetyltransferase/peptidase C39 family protein [Leptospiraceae bacterium]
MIRLANIKDINSLLTIENNSFETDKLSRRNFKYMLTKANAIILVDEESEVLRGYSLVLFNMGTSLARLYSIAVDPGFRGKDIGYKLLQETEKAVLERDCISMRLEVRTDNTSAQQLYQKMGYKKIGQVLDYYEDHTDAIRYEKMLTSHLQPFIAKVPYYQQTLDFTCGPSAIMMAMSSLDSTLILNRNMELQIWREATTIFMTSGHGGCGPYGLALSAYHRGYGVELYLNDDGALFLDSVRNQEKKEVMRLVQEGFRSEIQKLPIKLEYRKIHIDEIQEKFTNGAIPVVLISSYRIYREKFPHWIVITGFDDKYVYFHDPFVDDEMDKTLTDCINMPILKKDFERMARYGKSGLKATLIIKKIKKGNK